MPVKISLSKKQGNFLYTVISHWDYSGLLDTPTKEKLMNSIEIRTFDWKKLAKYSFWVSILCLIIAVSAVLADKLFYRILEKLFSSSNTVVCLIFAVLATGFYCWAFYRRKKYTIKMFSNEFLVVLGIIFTAISIVYLGKALDMTNGHFSTLILLATIVYGCIGIFFPSKIAWIFTIVSLAIWYGTETGYVSGQGGYYLGMNYALRFALFGFVITLMSFVFGLFKKLAFFRKTTLILGLLFLFDSLWMLSIFGNTNGDWGTWMGFNKTHYIAWGLIFGLIAIAAIVHGLKYDDSISRGFGITFLFINLYSRYFEYFWNITHKAIFFFILALTFWLIGKNAEKIWNLKFLNKKEIKEE